MATDEYKEQFGRFQGDIAKHAVSVLRDDGLYRHLRCRRGDSYTYGFDIVTWPGYLCYTGDMGCFVFTRLPDMFGFFRGRREALVDRSYLAEKCVAADKSDGVREYSESLFERAIRHDYEAHAEDLDEVDRVDMWNEIESEVLPRAADGMQSAVQAALDFEYRAHNGVRHIVFADFWEHRLEDYTPRFWWCCYAIPWAIEQYDAMKPLNERTELPQSADAVRLSMEMPIVTIRDKSSSSSTPSDPLLHLLQHWREEADRKRPDGLFANSERTVATYRKCISQLEAVIATLHQDENTHPSSLPGADPMREQKA